MYTVKINIQVSYLVTYFFRIREKYKKLLRKI